MKGLLLLLPVTVRVWIAGHLNNPYGKRRDVHDRTYKYVYKRYGHRKMVDEFKTGNTWKVPS